MPWEKILHFYFISILAISDVQALMYSHKNMIGILSTFSDSFLIYLCSYHVLLPEFCTLAAFTGFYVFTLKFTF